MPNEGQMLELVQYLLCHTNLSDEELVNEAHRLVRTGQYKLNGIFAGSKFEH